jgi:high-affinity nickel permease
VSEIVHWVIVGFAFGLGFHAAGVIFSYLQKALP